MEDAISGIPPILCDTGDGLPCHDRPPERAAVFSRHVVEVHAHTSRECGLNPEHSYEEGGAGVFRTRRREPEAFFEQLLVDELSCGLVDSVVQPLIDVFGCHLSQAPRYDRKTASVKLGYIQEESFSGEVLCATREELQGISLDEAREEVSRSFVRFGTQRFEALAID